MHLQVMILELLSTVERTVALEASESPRTWGGVDRLFFVVLHVRGESSGSVVTPIANHALVRLLVIMGLEMDF